MPSRTTPTPAPAGAADTGALLARTAELATGFLDSLDKRPVHARATRAELLAALGGPLPEHAEAPEAVVEHLAREAERGLVGMAGPRYFGFVIGGSMPAALAADWLTSTWDQNAGIYAAGPAASVAEEVVGAWLLDLFDLPRESSFGLTTGCQMAHVTCLMAARHRVLQRAGRDVEADGLTGAPAIDVLVGDETHATIPTALQYLGLGRSRATLLASDGQGRLRLDALEAALPAGAAPLIVILQAGNVNTGSFDPLREATELVRERRPDAWIHVDGAFGLWARAEPSLRHLADGVELADSWATDGHKWLNVPYDCGYAIVRDPEAHRTALSPQSGAYIVYGDQERDETLWVPEYSRRARGFASWAALRSQGREGIATLVRDHHAMAVQLADGLRAAGGEAGVDVLNDVVLNQALVRFRARDGMDADERTREVIRRVQDDGTCWVAGTTWQGMAAMRFSVVNWSTTPADIDRALTAILRAAQT
jgi:glutamate/tyrosine decarboxylase-like PLP-dependent enzyme